MTEFDFAINGSRVKRATSEVKPSYAIDGSFFRLEIEANEGF